MIPADRERLSLILKYIDDNESDLLTSGVALMLNEARAIVDHPVDPGEIPNIIIKFHGPIGGLDAEAMNRHIKIALREHGMIPPPTDNEWLKTEPIGAPSPGLDAFLTEPIHEYTDRIPTRHRHRALSPLRIALALTLAAIGLIAATTLTTPTGGTERPNPESRPAKQPSAPSQTGFWPSGPTLTPPGAP